MILSGRGNQNNEAAQVADYEYSASLGRIRPVVIETTVLRDEPLN